MTEKPICAVLYSIQIFAEEFRITLACVGSVPPFLSVILQLNATDTPFLLGLSPT